MLEYVAFDVETTGLVARIDRVVELGAVRFDARGRELGRFQRLVNPGRPIPPSAGAIHGITDADVADAPRAEAVLPEFLRFLGEPVATWLLAHNAGFDGGFLSHELGRAGLAWTGHELVDTLPLARHKLPGAANHKLDTLAQHLGLTIEGAHRALGDSLRVMGIWLALWSPDAPLARITVEPVAPSGTDSAGPSGWQRIAEAIAHGHRVRMLYRTGGGFVGPLREITPRQFYEANGFSYLLALCHMAGYDKSFRLDRILEYEVIAR
jgi:DNA polymerase III subunit epsilon